MFDSAPAHISAVDAAATLTTSQVMLIVAPATIALVGVIITAIVASVNVGRAEDRRTRNAIVAQLLETSRSVTLNGLYVVAAAVSDLKAFNRSMYGNTGKGEDDERSAAAVQKFFESFMGLDGLARASIELQVLGATGISRQIDGIRQAMVNYFFSLDSSTTFKAAHAQENEAKIDALVDALIRSVRDEFGIDAARDARPGAGGSNPGSQRWKPLGKRSAR